MEYIKLLVGFVLLIYSGDFLVRGGVALARNFNISTLVIGVTVVSMGTSLPELFVSANAAIDGYSEIAIGNVMGSNIANIALVLGITAIIFPMPVKKTSAYFDTPFMIVVSFLLYYFLNDNRLTYYEGIVFLVLLLTFIFYTFRKSAIDKKKNDEEIQIKPQYSLLVSILIIFGSSIGLYFGSELLVNGAVFVAHKFNVSETVISVTMVAFGTSVPELATSVIAAVKKHPDISVGNIVGSNIFNILAVLGITSVIKEINIKDLTVMNFHIYWMLSISVLLFISLLPFLKLKVNRIKGAMFFIFYLSYVFILFSKQS